MNINAFTTSLTAILSGYIAIERMKDPAADDATIAARADGDLKHYARGKVGWVVDLLWPFIEPEIDQAIQSELKVEKDAAPPAPPTPDTTGPLHMETATAGGSGTAIPLGPGGEANT